MANIITGIRLSGITYQIQGSGGGGTVDPSLDPTSTNPVENKAIYNKFDEVEQVTAAGLNALNDKITPTVELTQAQYDALVDKDPNTYYIITDAQAGDLTNYYTKTETNTLLGGKQATLISGTNIKTINNESILGSGNIDIQGGSTYTAGRGISIANDTISFSLPIYDKSNYSISECHIENSNEPSCSSNFCHLEQPNGGIGSSSNSSHKEGLNTRIGNNSFSSHVEGYYSQINNNSPYSHAEGYYTEINNPREHASGSYNVSNITSSTFGNSGNTLFSVGNGTSTSARHNAFEIRQNGDIYLTKDGQDVKLQDQLGGGGGGGTVESAITSGSTNAVESKAIWSATTFNKNILLTFDGIRQSTNYPKGCGKLVVGNIENWNFGSIQFRNDEGTTLGSITINNNSGNITVDTSQFEGATYEIDGTTVIISYPSTDITLIEKNFNNWTYTAVVEGAWVNENTYMKYEVDAIANGLQNSKLDATAYTPTVVDSALNVASTNPVQNQALYSELRIDNGDAETTLTFENDYSTNYPNGCTKLNVEVVGSNNMSDIYFYNNDQSLGSIRINNWGSISVTNTFGGASYEISGTTVIITYPTVTSVTKIRISSVGGNYVYKAIAASATHLKDQVVTNTTALGGLSLVKLTQAEYDALATKDNSTLYVIVN